MPQFLKLQPPFAARERLLSAINESALQVEMIPTMQAIDRVLAENVYAPHPMPEFARSTVDGYAVQSASTNGASESLPAYCKLVGEVPMGMDPGFDIHSGEAALIHTGGMIPAGADAVVMLEQSQQIRSDEVELYRAVSRNENVILVGEDVQKGDLVIPAGRLLRLYEIGGLMSIGLTQTKVVKKPVVGILSSGDEVVPADKQPEFGQVRDINSATMSLLVEMSGGVAKPYGIVPDSSDLLADMVKKAFGECDMILVTAGSSASERDMTADVVQQLGMPGVLAHGVNVRPGKPTILAVCDGKPVVGLPGNPVSAIVIASIFVKPVLHKLLHQENSKFVATVMATLSSNIPSVAGREDWVPVHLKEGTNGWIAEPIYFKSNLIFNLVKADALVHISADETGLQTGKEIHVELL